jgi:hypothetical protein
MNWEAIGAIAELLGATGVVISLVYLGVQVKAARDTSKKLALQSSYQNFGKIRQSLFESAELSRIFLSGLESPNELTQSESFRFMAMSETMFLNGEEYWLLSRNALKYLAYYKSTPGGQSFWNHPQSQNLSQEFRQLIDEQNIEGVERFDLEYAADE